MSKTNQSKTKLIVLTLDAFAPSALGCYGSSWNSTPAIDALAAGGCVWDRLITNNTDATATLEQWMQQDDWMESWKPMGSIELLSDSQKAISLAAKTNFDQLFLIDPVDQSQENGVAEDLESTQFAQLIAAAVERLGEDDDWSVLWLHSDFLRTCWDAPRWLVDAEPLAEWDDEPLDAAETLEAEMLESNQESTDSLDDLPYVFDQTSPPEIQLKADEHPDLIATWMRTYGCQVRLVDELLRVLVTATADDDVTIVLAGTSGISLGQNGWIGYQAGPLRSCHIGVPMIVAGVGPTRIPQVRDASIVPDTIAKLSQAECQLTDVDQWSHHEDVYQPRVVSRRGSTEHAITTPKWFFVEQKNDSHRLYLKPDDINDFNDISRLRSDVVDELSQNADSDGA
ncbi:hypothetical protein [Planctomycetes bacterium K23_9]